MRLANFSFAETRVKETHTKHLQDAISQKASTSPERFTLRRWIDSKLLLNFKSASQKFPYCVFAVAELKELAELARLVNWQH